MSSYQYRELPHKIVMKIPTFEKIIFVSKQVAYIDT